MGKKINKVISGKYEGKNIESSSNSKFAKISGGRYITSQSVKEIKFVNQTNNTSYSQAALGTAMFGVGGAALGANISEILLEIHWKEGDKSLVKVNKYMYELITIGMFEKVDKEQITQLTKDDKKSEEDGEQTMIILIVICLISAFLGSAMG